MGSDLEVIKCLSAIANLSEKSLKRKIRNIGTDFAVCRFFCKCETAYRRVTGHDQNHKSDAIVAEEKLRFVSQCIVRL